MNELLYKIGDSDENQAAASTKKVGDRLLCKLSQEICNVLTAPSNEKHLYLLKENLYIEDLYKTTR